MATAPYQLWLDTPAIASASRTGSTVTITTVASNSVVVGDVVQVAEITGTAGTSMNGVYTVLTTPSGSAFTYTAVGSAGTGTVTDSDGLYSAVASQDLFNPLINYTGSDRQAALYVPTDSVQLASSGDGEGATMSFSVMQDDTPAAGPWFKLAPDEARVRLAATATGGTPAATDILFLGIVSQTSSRLNGSGQGTMTDVSLQDNNTVLDRLVVLGRPISAKEIRNLSRVSNVTTATTFGAHGYSAGNQVTIANALGGSDASFNGEFTIAATPTPYTFTYSNSGANQSNRNDVDFTSVALATKSVSTVRFTCTQFHGLKDPVAMRIINVNPTLAPSGRINTTWPASAVRIVSNTVFEINTGYKFSKTETFASNQGSMRVSGQNPTVTPKSGVSQVSVGIAGNDTETVAVTKMLGVVNQYKATDYAVQRLINTSGTASIVGSSTVNGLGVGFPPGSLRSALDAVVESYAGQDTKERRYFVDLQRNLNFALVDPTAVPTYATAPYKIITSGTANTDTTTAAATLMPFNLQVAWDYGTTKQALVSASALDNSVNISRVVEYSQLGFTARPGAPVFDEVVDAPTAASNLEASIPRIGRAFFLERHKPVLTGTLEIRGRGAAAFNQYGYNSGYAQTGASTFALVTGWKPGQWVDIECAELGVTGKYRIEAVDWSLEPGSFTSRILITFNRRPPNTLTAVLQKKG